MATMHLERQGPVAVLHLTDGENRFTPTFLEGAHAALDEVEALEDPVALVTAGEGKFFSNGLDLETLTAGGDAMIEYLADCHALLARVLGFPVPTVAAVNGHAFAGGGMLALCHDQRVMRSDRGFFCLPEIDLGLPFSLGMHGLITSTLPPTTAREAMLTGRRYGGSEALTAGIVDAAVAEDQVLPAAVERAAAQAGKPRATLSAIKEQLFADALAALRDRG